MTEPQRDYTDGLQVNQETHTILKTLQEIASHDEVKDVAISCLGLLRHDDAEIRDWAIECLSSSVQPSASENHRLIEFLRIATSELERGHSDANPQPLADQMYWATTLIGRLELSDENEKASVRQLLDHVVSETSKPTTGETQPFASVAQKATRLNQRLS